MSRRNVSMALLLLVGLLGPLASHATAQADTLFVRDAGAGVYGATPVLFDQTLGINVNPAKLDATNDEVAFGASAGQTGGATPYVLISAATINATVVKASPGRLYLIHGIKATAGNAFLKIYDKATAPDPSAGDLPKIIYFVPASTTAPFVISLPTGFAFANGIGFVTVTGVGNTDETAVGANEVVVNLGYKN